MTPGRWPRRKIARIGIAGFLAGFSAALTLYVLATPALARNSLKLPDTQYEPITWSMIDGWAEDDHNAAFETFFKSCQAILKGGESRPGQPMYGALFKICQKAAQAQPEKPGEARAFFEQNFRPVRISPLGTPNGFVTGYYEPIVDGTYSKGDGYEHPIYRKPAGLGVSVSSGKKKKRIKRRLAFYDRAAIDDGALAGRDLEICGLKDPIDSFFIHIQGSVRVVLDDGKLMRLNYSAANGHPYYAVGRWLIDKGIIDKEEMSMDRIREWMERNPEEGKELRRRNKSYVFFRETHLPANEEPIGAQGISLTPGRSIAVDRKLHTYGTPFFISAYLPIQGLKPDTWFKRLMIAQDTGGAIIGPARADLYFGAGDEAASIAGRLRHDARFVMLAPKELLPAAGDDDEIPLPRRKPTVEEMAEFAKIAARQAEAEIDKPETPATAKADIKTEAKDKKEAKHKSAGKSEKKAAAAKRTKTAEKTPEAKDKKPATEEKPAKKDKPDPKAKSEAKPDPKTKPKPKSSPAKTSARHDPAT